MPDRPYLIPVENQVRELDAKLLLACFAAEDGRDSYIGYKGAIDRYISSYPRGIYFAKSLTLRSVKILRIAQMLGHRIVAWDEEGIVHFRPDIYYQRRLCREALEAADRIYAWGEDNKHLFEDYEGYPGTPIEMVGNPRIDLLRPEFRAFYEERVSALKDEYGDFILFNTNFGSVNGFYPEQNVCYRKEDAPDGLELGRGAIGFSRDFALKLFAFRTRNYEAMRDLVHDVARAHPERRIVIRPHPSENRETWREHVAGFDNVTINAEGNVVPWLLAASVLVHNACTTGIESYILNKAAVAFVPQEGTEVYGSDLPNRVSHVVETPEAALELIGKALNGAGLLAQDEKRSLILAHFLTALEGDFSAKRIARSVSEAAFPETGAREQRLRGTFQAQKRRFNKWLQELRKTGRYDPAYRKQRFPKLSAMVLQSKADSLAALAGLECRVDVSETRPHVFKISRSRVR